MKEKRYLARDVWQLSELKTIYETDNKAVYTAVSAGYGPVILKINNDGMQLTEEYTMLHRLNGSGCCRIYAFDAKQGMLLEERLVPGTVLREEETLNKRVAVFKEVFSRIHQKISYQELRDLNAPVYFDWLEDIYRYCVENDVDVNLLEMAKQARDICAEMFQKYPERVLLHGDLHHDNILLKADGSYAMIDPKGVIGPEIFDLPRYIMNEIDTKHISSDEEHMREVVRLVSVVFDYPIEDVTKLYFMEVILGNLWCYQDGEEMNEEEIAIASRILGGTI